MSGMDRLTDEALNWAVEKWRAEVANRPLQNVHRSSLDTTWRQVIRYFGGDDVMLVGPTHHDLVDTPEGRALFNRRASQAAPAQNEDTDAETKTLSGAVCADLAGSDSMVGDHRALIEQANAILSINASGAAYPRVPNMAAEIIKRLVSALTAAPAPSDGLRDALEMPDDFISTWHEVTEWCAKEGETVEAQTAWGEVTKRLRAALTPAPAQEGGE